MPKTYGEPDVPLDIAQAYQAALGSPISVGDEVYRLNHRAPRGTFSRPSLGVHKPDTLTDQINGINRDLTAHNRPVITRTRGRAHLPGWRVPHITVADLNMAVFGEESLRPARAARREADRAAARAARNLARLQRLLDWLTHGPVPPDPKPRTASKKRPRQRGNPRTRQLPGSKIRDSALIAAHWLAMHFPRDAVEQGFMAFITARKREILNANFLPRYWQQASHLANLAEVTFPDWQADPTLYNVVAENENNQRSIAIYGRPDRTYPLPATGTEGAQPAPSYKGSNHNPFFRDDWLSVLVMDYLLPRVYRWEDAVPVFAHVNANWRVQCDSTPTKIQYSTLHRPVFYDVDDPKYEDQGMSVNSEGQNDYHIARHGRFFRHKKQLAISIGTPYDATESRQFLLDCNLGSAWYDNTTEKCSHIRLKLAPAAAKGKYYAINQYIKVDFEAGANVWMARHRDPDIEFVPPLREFSMESLPALSVLTFSGFQPKKWYIQNFHIRTGVDDWTMHLKSVRMKGHRTGLLRRSLGVAADYSTVTYPNPFFVGNQADPNNPFHQWIEYDEDEKTDDTYYCSIYYPGGGQLPQTFPGRMTPEEWEERYIPLPDDMWSFGEG